MNLARMAENLELSYLEHMESLWANLTQSDGDNGQPEATKSRTGLETLEAGVLQSRRWLNYQPSAEFHRAAYRSAKPIAMAFAKGSGPGPKTTWRVGAADSLGSGRSNVVAATGTAGERVEAPQGFSEGA